MKLAEGPYQRWRCRYHGWPGPFLFDSGESGVPSETSGGFVCSEDEGAALADFFAGLEEGFSGLS